MKTSEKLKGVEVKLSKEVSERYFHTALCNGLGEMRHYGLQISYIKSKYQDASKSLKVKMKAGIAIDFSGEKLEEVCFEDVLMEILKTGGKLSLVDVENDGDCTKSITLKDVHNRVMKTPMRHLVEYIGDTGGDATTADVIIQTVFYESVIFG